MIQKLVGANQTVQADKIIFITTSCFSKEAIQDDHEIDVELIDGDKLINLTKQYFNNYSKIIQTLIEKIGNQLKMTLKSIIH